MVSLTTADVVAFAGAVGSVVTAIGVFVAARQLRLSKQLAMTQFEDQLSSKYREAIQRIPVQALLGDKLSPEELERALHGFYHYFDLSNEQIFLHESHRISKRTWLEWSAGIQQNLGRPAFKAAWSEIARRAPESFDELRRLVPPETQPRLDKGVAAPGSAQTAGPSLRPSQTNP